MDTSYDRRAPAALIAALAEGGFANSLVDYGTSGMYGLDLQLRGRTATLYIGTTKALDLHVNAGGQFRLTTHSTYAGDESLVWHSDWSKWQDPLRLLDRWDDVEGYLDRVISHVSKNGKHLQEGAVQSAVSRYAGNPFTMVDREAVVSFASQPVKNRLLKAINGPWLAAAQRSHGPAWWSGSVPTKSSTECDVLAISDNGQLTTIEIKPSSASASSIAWAPLQARQYADQFQWWLSENGRDGADAVVELMRQQQAIGTRAPGRLPKIDIRLPVKPLVVIDSRVGATARARVGQVLAYLRSEAADPMVEIRTCNLIGRLSEPWRD